MPHPAAAADGQRGGPRALDHLVLPCDDLAAAAAAFAAIGFTVGRRNRHPWGTENQLIQFPGVFLEPLALAPDYVPLAPADPAFPFAGFLAGQGRSAEPSGMIVLRSPDAAADAAAFAAMGLGTGRRLDFSRSGQAPDGSTRTVAFSLAFADAEALPDLGLFVCHHHHPENFWNPAMQRHDNGVMGITAVVIEAPRPAETAAILSRLASSPPVAEPDGTVTLDLGEGTSLRVTPAATATARLAGARLAGIVFAGPQPFDHLIGRLRLTCGS